MIRTTSARFLPIVNLGIVALAAACSRPPNPTHPAPSTTDDPDTSAAAQLPPRNDDPSGTESVARCVAVGDVDGNLSPETLAENWSVEHEVDGVALLLPKDPDTLELPDGSGRVVISDEFGDAFGVLVGSPTQLPFALGRAIDRLHDVEWGEASDPQVPPEATQTTFVGFGQDFTACWERHGEVWLFAVVPVDRQPLAKSFVDGASLKSRR